MSDIYVYSFMLMDTVVTIQVVGHGESAADAAERAARVDRAVGWFQAVEAACNRFDLNSESSLLTKQVGSPVKVTALLFEAVRYALVVAEETDGAFDPTIGTRMEARGFNREYRTGQIIAAGVETSESVSFRDVDLDANESTITLHQPLLLDLGAVAKGLAVDLAARELQQFGNFAIDAGGDLYLGGCNQAGKPWSVGIRHPRSDHELIATLFVSDLAVCTSGDYERGSTVAAHHIMDPRTGASTTQVASATVLAPSAMVADALGTAAFVLGPDAGIALLQRQGVQGMIVSPTLERFCTSDLATSLSAETDSPAVTT